MKKNKKNREILGFPLYQIAVAVLLTITIILALVLDCLGIKVPFFLWVLLILLVINYFERIKNFFKKIF
jgi:hypothetical protein